MTQQSLFRILVLVALLPLASCTQDVTTGSIVYEDGRLGRIITFHEVDSSKAEENIFGINAAKGWETQIVRLATETEKGQPEYDITLKKTFKSIEQANQEMNPSRENVFRIETKLQKRFRWFFTYYDYSDTFINLDQLDSVQQSNYFTQEDFAFIDRLPAEGSNVPKNDEYFFNKLSERIVDDYLGEEVKIQITNAIKKSIEKNTTDTSWQKHLYSTLPDIITKDQDDADEKAILREFLRIAKPPVDTAAVRRDFLAAYQAFNTKIKFLQDAGTSTFTHVIQLPWTVVASNADSVSGSALIWQPPSLKFYLKDYTMKATARTTNTWAMVISVGVILITGYLFIKRRSSSRTHVSRS